MSNQVRRGDSRTLRRSVLITIFAAVSLCPGVPTTRSALGQSELDSAPALVGIHTFYALSGTHRFCITQTSSLPHPVLGIAFVGKWVGTLDAPAAVFTPGSVGTDWSKVAVHGQSGLRYYQKAALFQSAITGAPTTVCLTLPARSSLETMPGAVTLYALYEKAPEASFRFPSTTDPTPSPLSSGESPALTRIFPSTSNQSSGPFSVSLPKLLCELMARKIPRIRHVHPSAIVNCGAGITVQVSSALGKPLVSTSRYLSTPSYSVKAATVPLKLKSCYADLSVPVANPNHLDCTVWSSTFVGKYVYDNKSVREKLNNSPSCPGFNVTRHRCKDAPKQAPMQLSTIDDFTPVDTGSLVESAQVTARGEIVVDCLDVNLNRQSSYHCA